MILIKLMIIPGFLWLFYNKLKIAVPQVEYYLKMKKKGYSFEARATLRMILHSFLEIIVLIVAFKALA